MDIKPPTSPPSAPPITLTEESLPSQLPIYVTTTSLEELCDTKLLDTLDSTLLTLTRKEKS